FIETVRKSSLNEQDKLGIWDFCGDIWTQWIFPSASSWLASSSCAGKRTIIFSDGTGKASSKVQ
ncbi:hypothetical protein PIB30_109082, partial [Stylosanthes scabra]|nr:hypothetical protein [Stylosanthes scabra]